MNSSFRFASYITLSLVWLCACFMFGFNQWTSLSRIATFAVAGTALLILILLLIKDERLHRELVEMFLVMGIVTALVLLMALIFRF